MLPLFSSTSLPLIWSFPLWGRKQNFQTSHGKSRHICSSLLSPPPPASHSCFLCVYVCVFWLDKETFARCMQHFTENFTFGRWDLFIYLKIRIYNENNVANVNPNYKLQIIDKWQSLDLRDSILKWRRFFSHVVLLDLSLALHMDLRIAWSVLWAQIQKHWLCSPKLNNI